MTQQAGFTPPPMNAPAGGGNFERHLLDAGTYPARLVWLINTGTQTTEWQGQQKKQKKLIMGYELPTELLPESHPRKGEPTFISETFTLSMGENAKMRPFIENWRGKKFTDEEATAFDIGKMVGAPAVITVIHKANEKDPSKVYANIGSISSEQGYAKMQPGFKVPPQINKSIYFNADWLSVKEGAEYAIPLFNEMPRYIQDKIMASDEWKAYTTCGHYIAPVLKESTTATTTQPQVQQPPVAPTANQQFPAQPQAQVAQSEMPPAQEFGDGSSEDDDPLPF